MTVRVAFTSCSDPLDAPGQPVWDHIAAHEPDHLVLLGDQIYMDYGILFVPSRNPRIGRPAKMRNGEFAAEMHRRYRAQWGILKASRLLQRATLAVHGIWDDHDFAWNNSHGDSGSNQAHGPGDKREAVSCDKQLISRRLMRDFFAALASPATTYPANPFPDDKVVSTDDLSQPMFCSSAGASAAVALAAGVKLLLTDGRSFRTRQDSANATVFGPRQWPWLESQIDGSGVVLLACGCTLGKGADRLDQYPDRNRLVRLAEDRRARLLCLTGDIHQLDWQRHGSRVFEAVASGAARPLFGKSGAYGMVEISDDAVSVGLYVDAQQQRRQTLDRSAWTER